MVAIPGSSQKVNSTQPYVRGLADSSSSTRARDAPLEQVKVE